MLQRGARAGMCCIENSKKETPNPSYDQIGKIACIAFKIKVQNITRVWQYRVNKNPCQGMCVHACVNVCANKYFTKLPYESDIETCTTQITHCRDNSRKEAHGSQEPKRTDINVASMEGGGRGGGEGTGHWQLLDFEFSKNSNRGQQAILKRNLHRSS